MATRTFTSAGINNLWSNPANWDGGASIPADNDVVIIPALQTCEFDVDQSGFANGIDGLTITGTLSLTRTAGTYYLKIKAAKTINGAGMFDCGTSVSPIPFAAKHTITGGAAWYINGASGLTMTVYAAEPINLYVKTTGSEAVGQTVLEVDTDITGDIWADGDEITISNYNGLDCEARVIAIGGIAASSITITSGLTKAKIANSHICLTRRNVRFIGVTDHIVKNAVNGKLTIAGGEFNLTSNTFAFSLCPGIIFSGGVVHGGSGIGGGCINSICTGGVVTRTNYSWYSGEGGHSISGGVYAGNAAGIYNANGNSTISGGLFTGNTYGIIYGGAKNIVSDGTIIGNQYGMSNQYGLTVSGGLFQSNTYAMNDINGSLISGGSFINNTYIFGTTNSSLIIGGIFTGNTTGFFRAYSVKIFNVDIVATTIADTSVLNAFNTKWNGTTEMKNYANFSKFVYSESIDHNQVVGAYKAWTTGGVTTSQVSVLPTGYAKGFITVLASDNYEGYWQREITVGAGASVNIETQLRKDASMTYLPRAIVFNKASTDPFAGGAGLHTFTMTDSVNTWESDLYTYTNSGTEDVTLVIRIQGMNATGNLYSALDVEQINVDLTGAIAKIDVIDALVDAIKAKTDQLAFTVANQVDSNSLTGAGTPADVVTALMAEVVEGTYTFKEILHIMTAVLAGKSSGGATANVKFRDLGDTKDRIDANVDANGNRLSVTLDGT